MTKQTTTVPAKWATYEREDLCTAQQMVDAGFTIEYSQADYIHKRFEVPHDGITFKKDNLIVWKVIDWITAKVVDGYYTKHKHYDRLEMILNEYK